MGWLEQINGWAVAIVFGLVTTLIVTLFAVVWRKGPPHYPPHKRLLAGAKKAPRAAWAAGITMTVSVIIAAGTSVALATASSEPDAGAAPTSNASAAPSPTSTPAATPQPAAFVQGGWGPGRDLAKDDSRPDSAMLNSVVDDPLAGDERVFMAIRLADDENAKWSTDAVAIPGMVYEIGINVNNDAKEGGEAAEGVRVRVEVPAVARAATAVSQTFVTSSNVTPNRIWAGITFVSEGDAEYVIRYVTDSAVLHTGGDADGAHLSDELFTEGALIGCDSLDGILPAGDRCRSWVSFKVRIDQPNFEVGAFVEGNGTDVWLDTHVAVPGELITVRTQYMNTGTTMQNDVVFKLNLPENVHYVTGTGVLQNPWNESLHLDSDENIAKDIGINVGSYGPGESVDVTFDVLLDGSPNHTAGAQLIGDFLAVETNNGTKYGSLTLIWF